MTWEDNPQEAFEKAISSGRLSSGPDAPNYAGSYLYMGTDASGCDLFKHRVTRQYIGARRGDNYSAPGDKGGNK